MSYRVVRFEHVAWTSRPHAPDEPGRHTAELSEAAGFVRTRANLWRYEPGARGRRHVHAEQEETFIVLQGTLSIYLGEPPERHDVPAGSLVHVQPGTPLQTFNYGGTDLLVYAYGAPPDDGAQVLPDAV